MIYNKLFLIFIIIFISSCKEANKTCNSADFKDLKLNPVNAVLRIPKYIIIDTIRCCDSTQIFNREIRSVDSSLMILAGIKSYIANPKAMPGLDNRINFERSEVESGQDSIQPITQSFKYINNIRIGYLKYLDKKRKRYESRIFFNRGKMYVDIWVFEKYQSKERDEQSIIDCIYNNIEID